MGMTHPCKEWSIVNLEEYGEYINIATNLTEAWTGNAQEKQKRYHYDGDKIMFKAGDRAFLYKLSANTGSACIQICPLLPWTLRRPATIQKFDQAAKTLFWLHSV